MSMIKDTDKQFSDMFVVCQKCALRDTVCKYADKVEEFIVRTMQEIAENPDLVALTGYWDCRYLQAAGWDNKEKETVDESVS